jgi:hypothetical protein
VGEFSGCGIVAAAAGKALIWPIEEVDAIFASLFRLLLCVLDDSGRVELDVRGQHCFRSIDQEEGCEANGTIWSGAQAPEH